MTYVDQMVRQSSKKMIALLLIFGIYVGACTTSVPLDNEPSRGALNPLSATFISRFNTGDFRANGQHLEFFPFPRSMDGYCAVGVRANTSADLDRDFAERTAMSAIPADSLDFDCILGQGTLDVSVPEKLLYFVIETENFYESNDLCKSLDRYSGFVRVFGFSPSISGTPYVYPHEAFYIVGLVAKICGQQSLAIEFLTASAAFGNRSANLELESLFSPVSRS